MIEELTAEQVRERLEALRLAQVEQTAHTDDGKRLGPSKECQHAGRWQPYCQGRHGRGTKRGTRV